MDLLGPTADQLDLNEGMRSIEDPAKWNLVNGHVPLFDPDSHVGVVKSEKCEEKKR